jgi:hypothetical protein
MFTETDVTRSPKPVIARSGKESAMPPVHDTSASATPACNPCGERRAGNHADEPAHITACGQKKRSTDPAEAGCADQESHRIRAAVVDLAYERRHERHIWCREQAHYDDDGEQ